MLKQSNWFDTVEEKKARNETPRKETLNPRPRAKHLGKNLKSHIVNSLSYGKNSRYSRLKTEKGLIF